MAATESLVAAHDRGSEWNDYGLLPGKAAQEVLAGAKVLVHESRRRVREPLCCRDVLVSADRKYLKEQEIVVADVLDVVRA